VLKRGAIWEVSGCEKGSLRKADMGDPIVRKSQAQNRAEGSMLRSFSGPAEEFFARYAGEAGAA